MHRRYKQNNVTVPVDPAYLNVQPIKLRREHGQPHAAMQLDLTDRQLPVARLGYNALFSALFISFISFDFKQSVVGLFQKFLLFELAILCFE
jgi:hypothetical protein